MKKPHYDLLDTPDYDIPPEEKKSSWKVRLMLIVGVIFCALALVSNAIADEDTIAEIQSNILICNKPEQVIAYVEIMTANPHKSSVEVAVEINKKVGNKHACGVLERSITAILMGEVDRYMIGDMTISIQHIIALITPPIGISQYMFVALKEKKSI